MKALPKHLKDIVEQEYPNFSDDEFIRRRKLFDAAMVERGVSCVIVRGSLRVGAAVQWFTGWPASHDAVVIVRLGEQPILLVNHYNHVPQAEIVAKLSDVRWAGPVALDSALEELKILGEANKKIGIVGLFTTNQHNKLQDAASELVDMNADYSRQRWIKSDEEMDWLRIGAYYSDVAVAAIPENLKIGMNEHELGAAVENSYKPYGLQNRTHYFLINDMNDDGYCVPRQHGSMNLIQKGHVVAVEMSAEFWSYAGQVLRTFTIGAEPTPLYKDLHDAGLAAYHAICDVLKPGCRPEDIIEAASVIEDAGFTVWDDLVHGYGGGYLPPVLGSKSRSILPVPDMTLEEGMCLVVQPNVITTDNKAGIQTGEMVRITKTGFESLHTYPQGLQRLDPK